MNHFVISIMSQDRVGIVYEVSSAVTALQGHIADLSQTVLRGYFTMIMHVTFPASVEANDVRQVIAARSNDGSSPLEVAIKTVSQPPPDEAQVSPEQTYVLTASGQNRLGFVATISAFCAQNNINILDLATKVAGPIYTMILLVDLSRCEPVEIIQQQLGRFSQETEMEMSLQHHDIFRVTSEITIR